MDIWVVSTLWLLWIGFYEHSCTGFLMDVSFHYSWVFLWSGIAGHMVTFFNLLKNCQAIFLSSCVIFLSYQQCMWIPVTQHLYEHFVSSNMKCCLTGFNFNFPNDQSYWAIFHVLQDELFFVGRQYWGLDPVRLYLWATFPALFLFEYKVLLRCWGCSQTFDPPALSS